MSDNFEEIPQNFQLAFAKSALETDPGFARSLVMPIREKYEAFLMANRTFTCDPADMVMLINMVMLYIATQNQIETGELAQKMINKGGYDA